MMKMKLALMNMNNLPTLKHKFRRTMQLLAVKTHKFFDKEKYEEHSDYEKECIAVCKALIRKEDTGLLISPISGKRFIKSGDDQIFIIIDRHQVTIVNHHYSYSINIWGKAMEKIVKMFDIETEKRREEMELEIRANVKHSLSNIYRTLSHGEKAK